MSHEPSHRKRDHVRLGDAHSERITSLLSLGSPSLQLTLRTKQYVKHHIFYTCICRVNGSREQKKIGKKKKKQVGDVYGGKDFTQTVLITAYESV